MTYICIMIKETRGRKSTVNYDFTNGEQWEFPKSDANKVRVQLCKFKKEVAPTWKFRTWIDADKLVVVRIK